MMTYKSLHAQMNIICIKDIGVVFAEAVDYKAETKSGEFIAGILRPIIERYGPEHVVALCMGGGSNYQSACKLLQKDFPHIEVVPCATDVLDLLMEDISKMEWAQEVVDQANDMISFLRVHQLSRLCALRPQLTQMVLHKDWGEEADRGVVRGVGDGWGVVEEGGVLCATDGAAVHGDEEDGFGGKGDDEGDLRHHAAGDGGVGYTAGGDRLSTEQGR
ncbi:unnamed protein product [Closterium sp. Naga37s-1]|nr:unnamed protein product [Closterium sp. Naga37s-1]